MSESVKFEIAFDSAVSLLSIYNFYLPQFINSDWKEDEYAVYKRVGNIQALGYLCRNSRKGGFGGYIEFEDNCSAFDRIKIIEVLKKDITKILAEDIKKKSKTGESWKRKYQDKNKKDSHKNK